jgi:hypothetical protein
MLKDTTYGAPHYVFFPDTSLSYFSLGPNIHLSTLFPNTLIYVLPLG